MMVLLILFDGFCITCQVITLGCWNARHPKSDRAFSSVASQVFPCSHHFPSIPDFVEISQGRPVEVKPKMPAL